MDKTILHIIDTTGPGGAETVFLTLAKSTNRDGFRSIAVIRGSGWVENQLKSLGIEYYVINNKGSFNIRYVFQLFKLIRFEKVKLIQAHLLGSNVYGSLIGILMRVPVVATFHGHVDISPNERLRSLKLTIIALGASRIVAVTQSIAGAVTLYGPKFLMKRLVTIPNGIETSKFEIIPTRNLKFGKPIVFGCLGNIRPAKNYKLAVDFIHKMIKESAESRLLIAGDSSSVEGIKLKAYINKLGLDSSISLLGFINEVPEFFSTIDVFLMTSSSEGHPLAITQALAAGKPILTTPSGVEKVIDNDLLTISAEHSASSLMTAFQVLKARETDSCSSAKNKRAYVKKNYSQETMVNQYIEYYKVGIKS